MILKKHEFWMQKAIEQAKLGKTPFGAVIVNKNEDYISAYNTTKHNGPTAHAELNAILKLKTLNFDEPKSLILYTTVEPCPMCMSAIVWTGIGQVVYGASINDAARFGKQIHINSAEIAQKSWYAIQILPGVKKEECISLLK
ncbi:hypothetical protein GCM10010832_06560 [Psychroflexus planctonicus]|uniref:CMP/dCMP-type deaminase domain-containing protein n=2 Tax=Psychroflexus planctonicus TaxID=1526575 RepID=A0ABQ1SFL6_9FLAO|nr:hypothetical protein GCM10010832_06560 [Psychroflexus planctonicus]